MRGPAELPPADISGVLSKHGIKPLQRLAEDGNATGAHSGYGEFLKNRLSIAYSSAKTEQNERGADDIPGSYYEFSIKKHGRSEILERKRDKMFIGAVKIGESGNLISVVAYIPHESIGRLDAIFGEYDSPAATSSGGRRFKKFVEQIIDIRKADIRSFWTDRPSDLPSDKTEKVWWEIWCNPESLSGIMDLLHKMNCKTSDEEQNLFFPENTIMIAYASSLEIEAFLAISHGIQELRRGKDTPKLCGSPA